MRTHLDPRRMLTSELIRIVARMPEDGTYYDPHDTEGRRWLPVSAFAKELDRRLPPEEP